MHVETSGKNELCFRDSSDNRLGGCGTVDQLTDPRGRGSGVFPPPLAWLNHTLVFQLSPALVIIKLFHQDQEGSRHYKLRTRRSESFSRHPSGSSTTSVRNCRCRNRNVQRLLSSFLFSRMAHTRSTPRKQKGVS